VIGLSVQSGSTFFHEVDYSWCKPLNTRSTGLIRGRYLEG
jgi:hypothetical protein